MTPKFSKLFSMAEGGLLAMAQKKIETYFVDGFLCDLVRICLRAIDGILVTPFPRLLADDGDVSQPPSQP